MHWICALDVVGAPHIGFELVQMTGPAHAQSITPASHAGGLGAQE
jgi:hypothetical protein